MPRRYVFEATVTGADGRSVTATREVLGLPALILGLQLEPVVERGHRSTARLLALTPGGALAAGQPVTVRVFQRQWHAQLRAGDYSSGVAKYVTETVDIPLRSIDVKTAADGPTEVALPVSERGVYVVELETRDALGRLQVVRGDFFLTGDEEVTWSRPPSRVFEITPDKTSYGLGDTARLIIQSPYQRARALMVVEAPGGNQYAWITIEGGTATAEVTIQEHYAPALPVHFLLLRPRTGPTLPGGRLDLGRPATLAATRWLQVKPSANEITLAVDHPKTARPGAVAELTVKLTDDAERPLPGEVTLWLVDQAVLALGREQRLNPMPDFLRAPPSRVRFHDTRNSLFGYLPFEEYAGGGGGELEPLDLLDNVTVRRRFVPVAFYAPSIQVDASGVARVRVPLPDNLSNFRLRAKAISGAGRFGHTTGNVAVRLPLMVQPQLPRFLRHGDEFQAAANVRITDDKGGPAAVQARFEGLRAITAGESSLALAGRGPHPLKWTLAVAPEAAEVTLAVAVRREDGAADAFEVTLPVFADREAVTTRRTFSLGADGPLALPALDDRPRDGSAWQRTVHVSTAPEVVGLLGAASYLSTYPYACTEQRIAKARGGLALAKFDGVLDSGGDTQRLRRALEETFTWIGQAIDGRGLVAYWPGGDGYVSLTAWSLQLVTAAKAGGFNGPVELAGRLIRSLRQALRSDYPALVPGSELAERAWALAALTGAGAGDPGYAAELALQAQFLSLENLAQMVRVLSDTGASEEQIDKLAQMAFAGIRTRLQEGAERYAGLHDDVAVAGVILPSEVRTMAQLLRTALALSNGARATQLRDALVARATEAGWGDTNANAAALAALAAVLTLSGPPEPVLIEASSGAQKTRIALDAGKALGRWSAASAGPLSLAVTALPDAAGQVLAVVDQATYLPAAPGAEVEQLSAGFVVRRDWYRIDPTGERPPEHMNIAAGGELALAHGAVIEERVELVNPRDRYHVALIAPLAAAMEPLNPALEGAPPEARASAGDSSRVTFRDMRDHRVSWFFDFLPKGTYSLRFRAKAITPGRFTQPPARAEMMYDRAIRGRSDGTYVRVDAGDD